MSRPFRLVVYVVLLAVLGTGGWFVYQRTKEQAAQQPGGPDGVAPDGAKAGGKLVVLVVFDQLRGDYLDRWAEQFGPDGFERMKAGGVWYSDCHLPYACTTTGPGHATAATGAPPAVHGIVGNEWYDRAAAAVVYCAQPTRPFDRVPPLAAGGGKPTRGAATGFSPERLLVETVGDRLLAANPRAKVVSLSIKDRTAVMMGGKTPTAAYCFDTRDGLFHTGSYYRDAPHPWVAEYNAGKPADAWVGKEWTRFRTDLDYDALAGPDAAPGEGFGVAQKRVFPHPTSGEKVAGPKYYAAVENSPFGNDLLFGLVKKAIAAEKLGTNGETDLLCVSFSSNDLIGHNWGPDSWEVLDVTLRSDKLIGEFLTLLDGTVGRDNYVVAITADHGVCPLPERKRYPAAARVSVKDVVPPLVEALNETFGVPPAGPTRWFEAADADAEKPWPWLYLNAASIKARDLDPDAVADYAAQWVGNRPFMLTAFTRKQIETDTLPPVSPGSEKEVRAVFERVKKAYHPARSGDVIGVPKPGVLMGSYPAGTSHGTPHAYDTHVPMLVYGYGVPALGKRDRPVSALIGAPILARALGVAPPAGATEAVPAEMEGK